MSWYVKRNYSISGPGFDITEPAEKKVHFGSLCMGRVVKPEWVPKAARQRKPHKSGLGDVTIVDGMTVVSQRFRDLIEGFEPGVHMFVPIRLERHDGTPIEGGWHFFTTQQDIDCVLTDNDPSAFHFYQNSRRWVCEASHYLRGDERDIRLSWPQIAGRHLWTGSLLGLDKLYVSDPVAAALRKGRFRYLNFERQCVEEDRPWAAEEQMGPMLGLWRKYLAEGRYRLGGSVDTIEGGDQGEVR